MFKLSILSLGIIFGALAGCSSTNSAPPTSSDQTLQEAITKIVEAQKCVPQFQFPFPSNAQDLLNKIQSTCNKDNRDKIWSVATCIIDAACDPNPTKEALNDCVSPSQKNFSPPCASLFKEGCIEVFVSSL